MSRFLALNLATLAALGGAWFEAPLHLRLPVVAAILFVHFVVFTRGVASPRSSIFLPVRARVSGSNKVALTFDDGPGEATRAIVAVLSQHGVKATFFVIGANVKGKEDVLRAASAAGHTIGSHSFAHSRLTNFLPSGAMTAEVERGLKAVEAAIGKRPRLYRPPVGLKSPPVAVACRKLGLVCVGWWRRALDGGAAKPDVSAVVSRLVAAKGGEIVLLHDGVEPGRSGDRSATVAALKEAIPLLKARGLELVTVDQLLGEKPYA
jgi:peptidoglycan/xylan/chitin deacetylase (PgdA/CDA1 family)